MRHDDDEECPTECEFCAEGIAAGQPVVVRTGSDGSVLRVCERCDTNNERRRVRLPASMRSVTILHRCDCQPCQSRRLVGGLVASVAMRGAA